MGPGFPADRHDLVAEHDRLDLLDDLQPEYIFVMIGINDLLQGVSPETVLANQRDIVRYLRQAHPNARIVLQSILPHSGAASTWEGRSRLQQISNQDLEQLNASMKAMAAAEQIAFLDLQPVFQNQVGQLRADLTTDGLHLSEAGYHVWGTAIQLFDQYRGL
jgi:lysophospholipase L1-like esterase